MSEQEKAFKIVQANKDLFFGKPGTFSDRFFIGQINTSLNINFSPKRNNISPPRYVRENEIIPVRSRL